MDTLVLGFFVFGNMVGFAGSGLSQIHNQNSWIQIEKMKICINLQLKREPEKNAISDERCNSWNNFQNLNLRVLIFERQHQ